MTEKANRTERATQSKQLAQERADRRATERAIQRAIAEREQEKEASLLNVDHLGGDHVGSVAWYDHGDIAVAGPDPTIASLRAAHRTYHDGIKAIREAALTRSPETTPEGHMMSIRRKGEALLNQAAQRGDNATHQARERLRAIDNEIASAIGRSSTHANEIRTYLRSLPGNEAASIVMQAARDGDRATLAAALDGPVYLSGITEEQRRVAKDTFLRTHMAETLVRRRAIEQALEVNRKASDEAMTSFFEMFDGRALKSVQDADAKARSAFDKIDQALA